MINREFWNGKRVLLTGHTGFKGGWMCLWLSDMGAHVTGLALDPETDPSLFGSARIHELVEDYRGDIGDKKIVDAAFDEAAPEIVFHMAAQPLVRRSYRDPVETYRTNVVGTAHVLDAARRCDSVRSIVVVTTDKCYHNNEWEWAYRETDRLGGKDPYSNSKACTEFVAASFRESFFCSDAASGIGTDARLATARAGNVIGGGDWSEDRLVPDIIRSLIASEPIEIRNPSATRPWQHVIEPLCGYLILAERLWNGECQSAYNFGPEPENELTVAELVDQLSSGFRNAGGSVVSKADHPKEAQFLRLDSSRAKVELRWHPAFSLDDTLTFTSNWFNAWMNNEDMREHSIRQIHDYETKFLLGN
ncbi:MAG: CDP-glucose 4,6-dehydratase [Hyphobacterium sp.]|nr:MAG: CDP-glucose 4,6-dehydratase [Hyphobacterium sp.]